MTTTSPGPQTPPQRWWQSINFWRVSTAAALLLASVLALKLWAPATAPNAARYVAVLQSTEKTDSSWIIEATRGGALRLTPLFSTELPPQKALQLWTRTTSGGNPTPLGTVPPDRPSELTAAHLPALERGQLFELTLEAAVGTPAGRAPGAALFVGRAVAVNPH